MNNENNIINSIYIIRKNLQHFVNSEFKENNLTSAELFFIQILGKKNNLTQQELSIAAACNKAHTHRIILKLFDKNIVEYMTNDENSIRNKKIQLSKKGLQISEKLVNTIQCWKKEIKKNIDEKDLELTKNVINKIAINSYKFNCRE